VLGGREEYDWGVQEGGGAACHEEQHEPPEGSQAQRAATAVALTTAVTSSLAHSGRAWMTASTPARAAARSASSKPPPSATAVTHREYRATLWHVPPAVANTSLHAATSSIGVAAAAKTWLTAISSRAIAAEAMVDAVGLLMCIAASGRGSGNRENDDDDDDDDDDKVSYLLFACTIIMYK